LLPILQNEAYFVGWYGQHCGPGAELLMKRLFQMLQRLKGNPQKPPRHTPEELECFKKDAMDNRAKHY